MTKLSSTVMRSLARTGAAVLVAALLLPAAAHAAPPHDVSGTAPGVELTARWWQVALTTGDLSFWDDSVNGDNCRRVDLPSRTLVMAAGSFSDEPVTRRCTIPSGATVVLPVINNLYLLTDPAPADTMGEARRVNRELVEGATTQALVDGVITPTRRIRSSAFMVNGAIFGYGPLRAASDGHWLVWEPADGVHRVETTGTTQDFTSATSYIFVVG